MNNIENILNKNIYYKQYFSICIIKYIDYLLKNNIKDITHYLNIQLFHNSQEEIIILSNTFKYRTTVIITSNFI